MTALPRTGVQTGIFGDGMFGRQPEENLGGVLDAVKAAGFDGVEVMSNLIAEPNRLRGQCAERGLRILGLHVFWWERDLPGLDEVASSIGAERLIMSCLPIIEPAEVDPVADTLAALSARMRRCGVPVLVHNHAAESRPMEGGDTPIEALADRLGPNELGFVIDLHWAAVAGTLLRTIEQVGLRCDYYHLKDGSITDSKAPLSYDLGTGEVDLAGAWSAIRRRPLSVVVIERGTTPTDPQASLRHDAGYVQSLLTDYSGGR